MSASRLTRSCVALWCLGTFARVATAQGTKPQSVLTTEAATRFDDTERRLAALLKAIRPTIDTTRWLQLTKIQKTWVEYRDAHCRWDSRAVEGGSMQPMWEANCRASLTEARIADLKHQLCEGLGATGDCPASKRFDPSRRKGKSST